MADTNENVGEASGKAASDAIFMMECLKHVQNPITIDINAVAAALNYKNSISVANRIRVLKKQFGLEVSCVRGPVSGGENSAGSPRKGAKTAQSCGPVKANEECGTTEGDGANLEGTKPRKKPGRRPKVAVKNDEADLKQEPKDEADKPDSDEA
ncbi:hypothetical protein VTO42DRAFT_3301 [Malbranchea cinnamomea]